jgi:hypothetical protein
VYRSESERRPDPEPNSVDEPAESIEAAEQELEYPADETDEG